MSASPIGVMGCLEVGAVVLVVAQLAAVVIFILVRPRPVACMARPHPAIPLDESELERARLSA